MENLSLDDVELIKELANSESTKIQKNMNKTLRHKLDTKIGSILQEYYKENTTNIKSTWTKQFEKFGISKDDGKAAIACARRLGIDIS